MTYTLLLIAYILLLAGATYVAWAPRAAAGSAARPPRELALDELAYLSGATPRLVEAAITRLFAAGAMKLLDRRFYPMVGHRGETPLEAALLASEGRNWAQLRALGGPHGETLAARLVRAGLLMSPDNAARTRRGRAAPHFVLAALGIVLLVSGLVRGSHGPWLGLIFIALALGAVIHATTDLRTPAGLAAIAVARERKGRLQRAPTRDEAPQAVALFGLSVLTGSSLEAIYQARVAQSGGGCGGGTSGGNSNSGCGSSGCGTSDSDGGCGGGGCGGGCGG